MHGNFANDGAKFKRRLAFIGGDRVPLQHRDRPAQREGNGMEMALNLRRRSAWAVPLIGAAVCWSMSSMRIGIDFQESDTLPWLQAARLDLGADLEAEVARLRINTAPYQSGDTQLLAVTLERAVATPIASDLQQRL